MSRIHHPIHLNPFLCKGTFQLQCPLSFSVEGDLFSCGMIILKTKTHSSKDIQYFMFYYLLPDVRFVSKFS